MSLTLVPLSVLGLTSAALFTGAALFCSAAEHPARMQLADQAALQQFAPSFRRAAPIQATLGVAAFTLNAIAY